MTELTLFESTEDRRSTATRITTLSSTLTSHAQLVSRESAEKAEKAGDWEAAFNAYCHLFVADRSSPDLREKLNAALRRVQQLRRHSAQSFQKFAGGMQLGDYRRNPIILWMHDPHNPVARCTHIGIADGALRGTGQFPPTGTTALADEICGLLKSGVVNAVSVGFEPIDTEPLDPKKPRCGLRILTSSLMEISLVAVGADTNALITLGQKTCWTRKFATGASAGSKG